MYTYCYHLHPVSQFVEKYGLEDVTQSLEFIEELTKRFTGEWAIRPLAENHEKLILAKMKLWAKHKNFHVRRLASEGLRPRLPWGAGIKWVNSHPQRILPILNRLRNDKVLYVRRSVANSLGDIIKLDEKLALKTIDSWLDKKLTPENLWVIRHGVRNPVKKGIKKYINIRKKVDTLKKTIELR